MKKLFFALTITAIAFNSCDKKEDNPADACFDFAPQTDIYSNDDITFTNCSKDADSYLWDFGDGNTSLEESPVHAYAVGGEYTVTLLAYGHKNDTLSKTVSVNAIEATACFGFSPSSDIDPNDDITFTNCSEKAEEYYWDFGDGNISTEQNPTHTYAYGGEYTVTLIAKNEINDTISKTVSVNATNQFSVQNYLYSLSHGLIMYFGPFTETSYNHDIVLLSDGIEVITQDGMIMGATGSGEVVYFELFTANDDKITDGEYVYSQSYAAGTFDFSYIDIGFDFETEESDFYYEISSGKIDVTTTGSVTNITMNLTTNEGYTVTGSFSGELPRYDVQFERKGSNLKFLSKK